MRRKEKTKQTKESRKAHLTLILMYAALIMAIQSVSIVIAGLLVFIIYHLQWMPAFESDDLSIGLAVGFMALVSLVFGTLLAPLTARIPLRPLEQIIAQMKRLSAGDYDAKVNFSGALREHPVMAELSDSFNRMAEELKNTEMMRGDFVNNFSHEFKTPIVSIAGFAKLLRRGGLSEEAKKEYLGIIEQESMRLSYMATNVLNLTKIENQTILSNVSEFNLSEQIRSCILLLENRWAEKNLEPDPDFDEYMITANEELLKEVWINLIDNAVKFADEGSVLRIAIRPQEENYCVIVQNDGPEIPEDKQARIFNKFYQADESHGSMGNGVGLAIVKRVVQLHHGTCTVESRNHQTAFIVTIPKDNH